MVINDYYEKSKEKIISSIENRDEEDFNSINLNFDELYLTKEEFLVLNSEIKNIISKYKEKRKKQIYIICFLFALKEK